MDVGADFPADTQSAEPAQNCEGRFDDPAVLAQAASVLRAAPGHERADAQLTDLAALDVVLVTAVGAGDVGALTGSSALAADGRYGPPAGHPGAEASLSSSTTRCTVSQCDDRISRSATADRETRKESER